MRVLVIGSYGLIGAAVSRELLRRGHAVVGLGRAHRAGAALLPRLTWIGDDLRRLTTTEAWSPHLTGIDAVVNASGVLQTGLGDDVQRTQHDAIAALIEAAEIAGICHFVQISAPGVSPDTDTAFYRSKAEADAALRQSRLSWTILRPGLVIAPDAYGGTRLLRMLAAVPLVQPIMMPEAAIQTVPVDVVAEAAAEAAAGAWPGMEFVLVAEGPETLKSLVLGMRGWLGFAPPRTVIELPGVAGRIVAAGADLAGWLGWRSALRSTAVSVLSSGVLGDGRAWSEASGRPVPCFEETLAARPSTAADRIAARAWLSFPILLLALSGFWIASGTIALWQWKAAIAVLPSNLPGALAGAMVFGGALMDIGLGAAMLVRRFVRPAALASVAVAFAYAVAGAAITPELWADPLGPMIKIVPVMALGLAVAALAEER